MDNPNYIKFIHVYGQQKDIKKVSPDLSLDKLLESFKEFCLGLGYHPNVVDCIQYVEKNDEKTN